MARRSKRRSNRTPFRVGSKWGVYVNSTLAYVSTGKLDANKAGTKLRKAGRTGVVLKRVGPNPISGKVPAIGWREQFKVIGRSKRNPARGITPKASSRAVAGRVGRAVGTSPKIRGYMGRPPMPYSGRGLRGGRLRNPNVRLMYGTEAQLPKLRILAKADVLRTGKTVLIVTDAGKVMARVTPQDAKPKSNPRRRNAASILRRRSNPTIPVWVPPGMRPPVARRQPPRSRSRSRAIPPGRYVAQHPFARFAANPRPGRRVVNPRPGYVVQVNNTVAWVGRTAADAKRVMQRLIRAGHKGVKGFAAKLQGVKVGWRKQYRRASNPAFGKGKLGTGSRFRSCVRHMSKRRGVTSPRGLCASIGRRKYGAKRMARMATKGRRRSNPVQPSKRWEGYFLRASNEKTVYSLGDLRRDQALRAAAGLARRKGADVTVYRGKTSLWPSGRTTYGSRKRIALVKVGS